MVPIKTTIANRKNFGNKRTLNSDSYIAIHYTANDGDTDENNGKYFQNNVTKSSANYFVDSDSITESVKPEYTAYAVGGKKYNTAGGKYYGKVTNLNSISIELCDDVRNGVIYPSAKTIANAIELVEMLMKKYKIPKSHVIRHYDVTGKPCPAYWVDDKKWKSEFWDKIGVDDEVVEKIKILVNGKPVVVDRILKDGTNYIKIRDIADSVGYNVGYRNATVTLDKK